MSPQDAIINEHEARQEARSKLRESFLRAINELSGKPTKILTYELSTLQARFSRWKPDGSEILVKDLETPANIKMPSALLRTTDLLAIHFDNQMAALRGLEPDNGLCAYFMNF